MRMKEVSIVVCMLLFLPMLSMTATAHTVSPSFDPRGWPTEGDIGVEYTFCFDLPTDPQGSQYFVLWEWGDETDSGWLGPYNSGTTTCASHAWNAAGVYQIFVSNKNEEGTIWRFGPFTIHIGEPQLEGNILFWKNNVTIIIKNTGDGSAYDVLWILDINGGIFKRITYHTECAIDTLPAGNQTRVTTTPGLFGFGRIVITITASAMNSTPVNSTVYGFIVGWRIILQT